MPSLLLQLLPYTSSVASLVGKTFDVKELSTDSSTPLRERLIGFLIDVVTLTAICALSAQAGIETGLVRGALVGTLSATAAYALPRVYLMPTINRLCAQCNRWGKLAIGLCALIAMFVLMLVFNWVLAH